MAEQERIKNLAVGNLAVSGELTVGGVPITGSPTATPPAPAGPRIAGGLVGVVGSGRIPSGLASIAAVVVSLAQDPSPAGMAASATSAGSDILITVAGADGNPPAASVPVVVSWIALGS